MTDQRYVTGAVTSRPENRRDGRNVGRSVLRVVNSPGVLITACGSDGFYVGRSSAMSRRNPGWPRNGAHRGSSRINIGDNHPG